MAPRSELHPEHLYRVLEQTLIPPVMVRELDPDTIGAAVSRLNDAAGTVSERYLLDSALTPAQLLRLPSSTEVSTIREYFFQTVTEGYDASVGSTRWARPWTDGPLAQLLSPAWTDPVMVQALYAVDVVVVVDDAVWRQVPGRPGLVFEQQLEEGMADRLLTALPAPLSSGRASVAVVAVGSHVRAQFTHGDQAAREIFIATGMIMATLARQAMQLGRRPVIADQFVNATLDSAVYADGVDRAVTALLLLADPTEEQPS